jgi:hypothetical protein
MVIVTPTRAWAKDAANNSEPLIGQYAWSLLLPGDPALAPDYSASAIRLDRKA